MLSQYLLRMAQLSENALLWLRELFKNRLHSDVRIASFSGHYELSVMGYKGKVIVPLLNELAIEDYKASAPINLNTDLCGGHSLLAVGYRGQEGAAFWESDGSLNIAYNFFNFIFWVLTRYEEYESKIMRDSHERFLAVNSHAFKFNYLDRPVVDEWITFIRSYFKSLNQDMVLSPSSYSVQLSHDVDRPSMYSFMEWPKLAKRMASLVIKKRDITEAAVAFMSKLGGKKRIPSIDPANTFSWIMNLSKNLGLKSRFYFICGASNKKYDSDYSIESAPILNLMKKILSEGHLIGIHPSYESWKSKSVMKNEVQALEKTFAELGAPKTSIFSRMHYLKWSFPETLQILNELGIYEDCSMGYPDRSGFRCGTSHSYQAFDLLVDKQVDIILQPLILMEATLLSDKYEGLGLNDKVIERALELAKSCKAHHGVFTLLWHNNNLVSDKARHIYSQIVQRALNLS